MTSVPRLGLFRLLQGVGAVGVRAPDHRLLGGRAGLAGDHAHLVGHHEGGVEADAELADQLGIVLHLPAFEHLHEFLGSRMGDGAEGLGRLVARHADAVVAHRQRAGFLVGNQLDLPLPGLIVQRLVGQGGVAGLVDGVRGVGDQFAQEDFLVGVQGMDHQVEDLVHLGLELTFAHGHGRYLREKIEFVVIELEK